MLLQVAASEKMRIDWEGNVTGSERLALISTLDVDGTFGVSDLPFRYSTQFLY